MPKKRRFKVTIEGRSYEVEVEEIPEGVKLPVGKTVKPASPQLSPPKPPPSKPEVPAKAVQSPLPGKVVAVYVKTGDVVKRGDKLLVIDSMKMENEVFAPRDGMVTDVKVSIGASVNSGDPLIILE